MILRTSSAVWTPLPRGVRRAAVAAFAACTALAGCATSVDGSGTRAEAAAGPTGFPSQPVRSPQPSVASPSLTPARPSAVPSTATPSTVTPPGTSPQPSLDNLLEPRPAGAVSWSNDWGRTPHPTVRQFVARFYNPDYRRNAAELLRRQGVPDIAHRTWIASGGDQMDIVLMRFRDFGGALQRYITVTSGAASDATLIKFGVGRYSIVEARGFRERGRDSQGYVDARVYANPTGSNILIEAFYFGKDSFSKATMLHWVTTQIARIH